MSIDDLKIAFGMIGALFVLASIYVIIHLIEYLSKKFK